LLQASNDFTGALKYVDDVRARVGLGGLAACNLDKNLTSNKANLLEEILRERACELGLEDSRYFDLVRYKRADRFETNTHGLRAYRLKKDATGKWARATDKWWNGDKKTDKANKTAPGFYEPTHFDFEKFELTSGTRVQWSGFDAKWYLQPFPQSEVNKKYGLVQNPGW
jgi:SusD family.